MKRALIAISPKGLSTLLGQLKTIGRVYSLLLPATIAFFLMLGAFGLLQSRLDSSPVSSMKGFAASVSSDFFADLMGMEIPGMREDKEPSTFSQSNIAGFLFRFVTDINPDDPKSFLAGEVPGLKSESPVLLRKGIATVPSDAPADFVPDKESLVSSAAPTPVAPSVSNQGGATSDREGNGDHSDHSGNASNPGGSGNPGHTGNEPTSPEPAAGSGSDAPSQGSGPSVPATALPGENEGNPIPLTTGDKKVVFIYHSHPWESYLPDLKNKKDPSDAKINVTLLGKRLAKKLEDDGIGALSSNAYYPTKMKNFNWSFSYKYSRATVKEAFAANPGLNYFIDIHRDSQLRKKTTAKIKGVNYAQVYFIIGHGNPNWKKNEDFATRIHEELEKNYPGLSRGIYGKKKTGGSNGEYNQSLSPNTILIEIGGIENSLQECYRTVDVLADTLSKIYWDAEKVTAPVTSVK